MPSMPLAFGWLADCCQCCPRLGLCVALCCCVVVRIYFFAISLLFGKPFALPFRPFYLLGDGAVGCGGEGFKNGPSQWFHVKPF